MSSLIFLIVLIALIVPIISNWYINQTTAKTTERIGYQLADGKLQDIRKQDAFRKLMILLIPCLQLCKYASSIGFKSGKYQGRYSRRIPAALHIGLISFI
jgi:hypothetical protein